MFIFSSKRKIITYFFLFLNLTWFSSFAVTRPDRYPDRQKTVTINGIKYKCEYWNHVTSDTRLATVVGTDREISTNLQLPATVELSGESFPYTLYRIGQSAFQSCSDLISIDLPITVSIIEDQAFSQCYSLKHVSCNANLEAIGKNAFFCCSSLQSITLPKSLTSIGDVSEKGYSSNPFKYCSSLGSINIEKGNTYFSSIENALYNVNGTEIYICPEGTIPQLHRTIKSIGIQCFFNNKNLIRLEFPDSIKEIKAYAFDGCSNLSDLNLPEGLVSIDNGAFRGCEKLVSVDIPNSVTKIGEQAFEKCSMLSKVTLPNNLQKLLYRTFAETALKSIDLPSSLIAFEGEIFSGCSFETLTIPENVKSLHTQKIDDRNTHSWYYPFQGFTCKYIYILAENSLLYTSGLNSDCIILADKKTLERTHPAVGESYHKGWTNGYSFEELFTPEIFGPYLTAVAFKLNKTTSPIPQNVTIKCIKYGVEEIIPNQNGIYIKEDLTPSTKYTCFTYTIDLPDANATKTFMLPNIVTNSIYGKSEVTTTQTKASFSKVSIDLDEYTKGYEYGIYFNNETYPYNGKAIEISHLNINSTYSFYHYIAKDNQVYRGNTYYYFYTKPLSLSLEAVESPTSIAIKTSASPGETKIISTSLKLNSTSLDFTNGVITGLEPETNYSLEFKVKTSNGSQAQSLRVKTPELVLHTLQPNCVSETCAIVGAETNISDDESNVGFEWKKYEAPASLPTSQGYGAVHENILEGYIKNLQPAFFYNTRPFYKSASGKYYYGEWITFDPSDFSYFEPTAHTYPVRNVTQNTATVRGYVLPGSDIILSQGFQYWLTNGPGARSNTPSDSVDIYTIEATGQVMTTKLENLKPATDYTFRVFVETSVGRIYGEEQFFTTEGVSSVIDIANETQSSKIMGYFNMMGIWTQKPHQGINIVVYSDGTSKKVMIP